MKIRIALISFLLFFIYCDSSIDNSAGDTNVTPDPVSFVTPDPGSPHLELVSSDEISRINIPKREHGYQFFDTITITSLDEFTLFLDAVSLQEFWNYKDDFISALQNADVDFGYYNIIIFRWTEDSGSTGIIPHDPVWECDEVVIHIDRNLANGYGTCDMAFYAFAYMVSNDIEKVVFMVNDTRFEIEN